MPTLTVSYTLTPADGRALAASVIDPATGHALSQSAKGFAPTTGATPTTDELFPLTNVGGVNWAGVYVGLIPLPAGAPASLLVYLHPQAGGPPIDVPVPAVPDPVVAPPGARLALILP